MTIEATLAAILAELKTLNEKFAHIGGAIEARRSQDADNAAREALQKARNAAGGKPTPPAAKTPEPAAPVSWEKDVKPLALALVKKPDGRAALTKIYNDFGVKLGGEVKPEKQGELKQCIEAALA